MRITKLLSNSIAGWYTGETICAFEKEITRAYYEKRKSPIYDFISGVGLFPRKYMIPSNIITLYIDAPARLTMIYAENGFNNSRKDLWLWYAGPWNKNKLISFCSKRELKEIKEELYFWIHNIYRLEKRLPPITNPLWLKNDSGDIVRLHATSCSCCDSKGGGVLNVKILASSPSKSLLDDSDFSERFEFGINFDCRILTMSFFHGRIDWEIVSPMAELDEDYKNWNTKFFKPKGF